MSRYHVYTSAQHPDLTSAAGHALTFYTDQTAVTLATLYAAETGVATFGNPYTVPVGAIVDFWTEYPSPWVLATGDTSPRPVNINIASGQVNVRDYGALGDGAHDDTGAIQEACNAGSVVYFPPSPTSYVTTYPITCVNNVLVGSGRCNNVGGISRVSTWDANASMFIMTGDRAEVRDMAFQGSGSPGGAGMTLLQIGNGTDWMADGIVTGSWFTGGGWQQKMNCCQGFSVSDNVFDGCTGTAVSLLGTPNLTLKGNRVNHATDTGILIQPPAAYPNAAFNYNILITDNIISQNAGQLTSHHPAYSGMTNRNAGIAVVDANSLIISNNQFMANYTGIYFWGGSGIGQADIKDVGISGNTFTGQSRESVFISATNRVTLSDNNFVPYVWGGRPGTGMELAAVPHVKTAYACDRIIVTGGGMVGNTNRVQGVQFGVGTTNSYVDNLMWEGLVPVVDLGLNTIGRLIPTP